MVSWEQTSLGASCLIRTRVEVGSHSFAGVSDIVHEVLISTTALMSRLDKTSVYASSGDRVFNNYFTAASRSEQSAIRNAWLLLNSKSSWLLSEGVRLNVHGVHFIHHDVLWLINNYTELVESDETRVFDFDVGWALNIETPTQTLMRYDVMELLLFSVVGTFKSDRGFVGVTLRASV